MGLRMFVTETERKAGWTVIEAEVELDAPLAAAELLPGRNERFGCGGHPAAESLLDRLRAASRHAITYAAVSNVQADRRGFVVTYGTPTDVRRGG